MGPYVLIRNEIIPLGSKAVEHFSFYASKVMDPQISIDVYKILLKVEFYCSTNEWTITMADYKLKDKALKMIGEALVRGFVDAAEIDETICNDLNGGVKDGED